MQGKNTLEKRAANKNGIKRFSFAAISIILEVVFWYLLVARLNEYSAIINLMMSFSAAVLVLIIYDKQRTSALKTPWIMLILAFPVLGVLLYVLVGTSRYTRKMRLRYAKLDEDLLPLLKPAVNPLETLKKTNQESAAIASYIYRNAQYPIYDDSDIEYFDDASKGLDAQIDAMARAEHFIFMEYHAIENGQCWSKILPVLEERVKAGVEVRVFYDDIGSIVFVTRDFADDLERRGIRCRVFNPLTPRLNMFLNNRDHRKITVVDGKVGFTGGYNLADEYFNITHPYGRWKDAGIKIQGPAVKNLTATFLEMWNAVNDEDIDDTNYLQYLPEVSYEQREKGAYIQPYADIPLDNMHIGEDVYINMINKANTYCYFSTPYLILSDEFSHAIRLAAMRGVDVRIVTPGIPDKRTVYSVTRSFYHALVADGVRIYEWTPGYCHAKLCVVDDHMATCGTINLDYRSLYHHFENGCFFCDCGAVTDIRDDLQKLMGESREVTSEYIKEQNGINRARHLVLRLFAGMM